MDDLIKRAKLCGRGVKTAFSHATKRLSEGWYVREDPESKDRAHLVRYNVTANVIANLIGGNFYTGYLLLLNADDAFIGLMTMLVFAANLLQLAAPILWERIVRRKRLIILMRSVFHLINILLIGLIPFLTGDTQTRLVVLALCVLFVNVLNAVIAPAMSVWHIGHIPPRVRVSYFSVVSILNGVCVAACNMGASALVDRFKASGLELYGLFAVRMLAMLVAVYDIWQLMQIREIEIAHPPKVRLLDFIVKPWKNSVYLRTVLIVFLWNLAANAIGSYYTVHLLRNVHVSYSFITLVSMMNIPVLLLATPVWRRIFAKSSWLKPLAFAMLLYAPRYILQAFVTQELVFLFPLGEIWCYICLAGINYAFCSVAYVNVPKESQTIFIGFYSTCANLGALLGSMVGRAFVTSFPALRWTVLGVTLCEKQVLMALTGIGIALVSLAVFAVWRANTREGVET